MKHVYLTESANGHDKSQIDGRNVKAFSSRQKAEGYFGNGVSIKWLDGSALVSNKHNNCDVGWITKVIIS